MFGISITAALVFSRGSWIFLFWLAALIHELGHLGALFLLRGHFCGLNLRLSGAEIRYDSCSLSYGRELLLVLAGPLMNLLCAVLCAGLSCAYPSPLLDRFAGCHLVLGAFNLLPALPLDGGRALQLLLDASSPMSGQRLMPPLSLAVGLLLTASGAFLLLKNGNLSLFAAGCVIFAHAFAKSSLHRGEKRVK